MATRKAITLVNGLFQEVNTPTDKLDFTGNTTADLGENTNLYFTNARSRAAVSVTDSGGFGSLSYNNSTGVITYVGTSNSDVRGTLSIASGSGLTYNSSTGEFGTSAIPNSQLANDDVTIGSTAVALGATASTIAGLTSLASTTLISGTANAANSISIASGNITFEGSSADGNETILTAANATGSDKTLTLPNETGTILTTASSVSNSNLANSDITIGGTSVSLGATQGTFTGLTSLASTTLISGSANGANSITLASGNITFEGSTADANEIILTAADASGSDKTITLPNATGTVALLNTLSVASGSGLTYNSGTGEFSTNAIPNSKLANSTITIGSTSTALGNSNTTFTGLSSITSAAVVTNDSGFRIRDNSDNTKQLAFECSGISSSTTRTLTVPDANDTLAVLTAAQTLTNKTIALGDNTVTGALANGITATTQSASDNTTKVATTAYVTTAINNLINGAPSALDTLNELAAAMNDDAAFSTTVTNSIATKMPLAGGQFTGNITFSGSQTVDGRDLSVDGSKLDGIESGATADQTASEIKTLLQSDKLTASEIADGQINSAKIVNGTIVNADINASAAIAGSKIADASINASDKLENSSITENKLGSGVVTSAKISDGTIVNADINASASISISKLGTLTANTLIGRRVSNGTPQELTASQVRTIINVEDGATADQTAAEIRALVESASDSNVFTDADHSKLNGIAASATNNGSGNAITDGDKGEITVSNSGGTFTVDNGVISTGKLADNAVTMAKLQDLDQNRIFGRVASGSGNPTALTAANVRSMINVEDGATADQSASEILTLLKTVDGSGSGLDADTLDGIGSGSFLRADAADFAGSDITFGGGAGAVTVGGGSDIRLTNGSWTGESTKIQHHSNILYIQGGSSGIQLRGSDGGSMALFQNSSTILYDDVNFQGGAGAVTIAANSDIRLSSGSWTGNSTKIQHHNDSLYIQGGSGANDSKAIIFRSSGGSDRFFVNDSGHFVPGVDSTYDIGLNGTRIRNGYFDTLYGDGSNLTGVNATTLDSIDSGSFLRSDTADTASGDITFNGGAAAVNIGANSDIRFNNGNWTGNSTKIQHHSNYLYIQGGSSGFIFRHSNGTDRWTINSSGHLIPATDSNYDIGSNGTRVANGYFDTLYGDGSNLTGVAAGATGGGSDEVFYENSQTVTTNYTITNNKNAMSAGPLTINSGVTVTVGSGENLIIL